MFFCVEEFIVKVEKKVFFLVGWFGSLFLKWEEVVEFFS